MKRRNMLWGGHSYHGLFQNRFVAVFACTLFAVGACGESAEWKIEKPNIALPTEKLGLLHAHGGEVRYLAFSPDGRLLATSTHALDGGEVKIWNSSGSLVKTICHRCTGTGLAWSRDGGLLATAATRQVQAWRTSSWELATEDNVRGGPYVQAIDFSRDGRGVLSTGDNQAPVASWNLWTTSGSPRGERICGRFGGHDIKVSPDGRLVAVACDAGVAVEVHDLGTRETILQAGSAVGTGVAWDADSRRVAVGGWASGGYRGYIGIWDVSSGKQLVSTVLGADTGLTGIAWSPSGRYLTACGVGLSVVFIDAENGQSLSTLTMEKADVGVQLTTSVAIAPDGRTLAVGLYDGRVFLFGVPTGSVHTE